MNKGAHVLVVSRDQMLLQTRKLILGTYFQVEGAGRIAEAEAALEKRAFDLIVLCYSLSDDEYSKLLKLTEGLRPRPRILTLSATVNGGPRAGGDGEYVVDRGPFELLKKTAEMVGFTLKPMRRATQS
jgi:DNA-binding NtrC family response regulator